MHIPEGYAQVNLRWAPLGGGHVPETTFGISALEPLTAVQIADLVATELTESTFCEDLSTQATIKSVYVKMGPNETGVFYEKAVTVSGTDTQQPVPPNCGILVRKSTGMGGRANSGRWFIPGAPESSSPGNGTLLPAWTATWEANWNAFRLGLQGADIPMVLLHSVERSGQSPLIIDQLSVTGRLATQRRRMG